ncbi:cellulose biosynthesis cyclic di-GMP-binding regulatory protein BcsB [Sulfitobacter sp. W002]|uniref:cellulose biosynthesis cyclic di-GMP-binding regulatory protein BcsB n=1 Tax=Sulfitobacter sp. W002 TaxID=2867024 RepID=UPI0021A5755C|nr:cellulose biosynthesis cyclic di-GMP-binding regulatory protein BcsB [Sulfitobacter sp. W002]UWR30730.1 cellulose biosynthesis cyclic di-GMP-binding regulatory protein BcsB [Sulfitobacter sp. W002]
MKYPAIGLLAALLPFQVHAQTTTGEETANAPAQLVQEGLIARTFDLAELGFQNGISFRQLSGDATIYIPLPDADALNSGSLQLELEHASTTEVDRYLQVSVAGRPVTSQALPNGAGRLSLPVPLNPEDVSGGFIAVGLSYSGALSDRVCVDERASGDFLEITAASSVTLQLDPSEIDTSAAFAGLRPANTRLAINGNDSLAALAAATRAAALFDAEAGRLTFAEEAASPAGAWSEGVIQLDVNASGVASEMAVDTQAGLPVLNLRGSDPQVGLWQMMSEWSALSNTDATVVDVAGAQAPFDDRLPLSALQADLTPRAVVSTEDFFVPFQSSDLPAGKGVAGVNLHVAAALDPEGRGATASVFLNDTLLGNRPLGSGKPEQLTFSVPSGLLGRDNLLRVSIQRQPTGGECRFKPQGYPAQILPGSALLLSDAAPQDQDFFALRQEFGNGVQVVLDPALSLDFAQTLPWLAGVAGSVIPDRATILPRASVDALEGDEPFFVISEQNPGDGDPLITFDQGRIEVRDRQDNLIYSGEDLSRLGVVQIVTRGDTRGLWLRPGNGPAPELTPERPMMLDRGDLALIGQDGVILATATDRSPLVDVVYPDRTSLAQMLAKYRPWIVGAIWVLVTLLVLVVFQRVYRARRGKDET